jgi:hypothetical protein
LIKLLSFAFALSLLLRSSALAAPMCITDTLAGYTGLGSTGCEIGSGTFSAFGTLLPITGAEPIAPEDVTIVPVQSGSIIGLDVRFNAATTASVELLQALIAYTVAAPSVNSSTVTVSGTAVTGGGFLTEIQNFCAGGTFLPGDVNGCTGTPGSLVVLNAGSDQATFAAVSQLSVVHDFTLDAGSGGTAGGGLISDRFSVGNSQVIPEPRTYVLMSSALLAIALRSRFSSRARKVRLTGGQDENA